MFLIKFGQLHAALIITAKSSKLFSKVVSEIEFASKFTDATLVAITGSNGKTTTASLTHHILKQDLDVGLAGNIGDSFAKQILEKNYSNDCAKFNEKHKKTSKTLLGFVLVRFFKQEYIFLPRNTYIALRLEVTVPIIRFFY